MPINLTEETVVPLAEAPMHIPGRPHVSTLYRWMSRPDQKLETTKIGGRIYTSIEAIQRFADLCTSPTPVQSRTTNQPQKNIDRKEAHQFGAEI